MGCWSPLLATCPPTAVGRGRKVLHSFMTYLQSPYYAPDPGRGMGSQQRTHRDPPPPDVCGSTEEATED